MIMLNGTEVIPTMFPDGTSQVWKLDSLRSGANVVVWHFEREDELIHLAQLSALLTGPNNTLLIPYLPYARQDKQVNNEQTFALVPFTDILQTFLYKYDSVWTFDPHSSVINTITSRFEHYPSVENTIGFIEPDYSIAKNYDAVILPDAGAYGRYRDGLCSQCDYVYWADKVRDPQSGYIIKYYLPEIEFNKNSRVLVFDDICDGGATFNILSESLKNKINVRPDLYVSHGIFSKGLRTLLDSYENIYTTDSYLKTFLDALENNPGLTREDPFFAELYANLGTRLHIKELNYESTESPFHG